MPSTRNSAASAERARLEANNWLSRALKCTPGMRGKALANHREALGLRQAEIARHMQARRPGRFGDRLVKQSTISAIESEEIGVPRGFIRAYVRAADAALREREMLAALRADQAS